MSIHASYKLAHSWFELVNTLQICVVTSVRGWSYSLLIEGHERCTPDAFVLSSSINTQVVCMMIVKLIHLPAHRFQGISAGGSMAAQHFVAFSSVVDGAALIAGSPYGCGHLPDFNNACERSPVFE